MPVAAMFTPLSNKPLDQFVKSRLTFPFDLSIRRKLESKLETSIESLGAVGDGTTLVTGAAGSKNKVFSMTLYDT